MKAKICNKCPGETLQPIENFYKQPGTKDGYSNSCKACKRADVLARHRAHKAGTFVNSHIVTVQPDTGIIKACKDCGIPKDLVHFREYTTKAGGKAYTYRIGTCRECERDKEQEARERKNLFNHDDFRSITDFYNPKYL